MAMFNGHVTNLPTEYAARYGGWHQQDSVFVTFTPIHVKLHSDEYIHIYKVICVYIYILYVIYIYILYIYMQRFLDQCLQLRSSKTNRTVPGSAWQCLAGWIWPVWSTTWAWCLGSEWSDPTALTCVDAGKTSRMEGMYSSSKELIMIYNQWLYKLWLTVCDFTSNEDMTDVTLRWWLYELLFGLCEAETTLIDADWDYLIY